MAKQDDIIGTEYWLSMDVREVICDEGFCNFLVDFVNGLDLSYIDSQYENTPGQKAYPAALLLRVILMGTVYSVHSSRKLERYIRRDAVFRYLANYQTPSHSTISAFKREHKDLIESVFLETINFGHNKDLIDLSSVSIDGSKSRACANKYNNLTQEDVDKLLHIIKESIIFDEEENKFLERCDDEKVKIIYTKEQIRRTIEESSDLKYNPKLKTETEAETESENIVELNEKQGTNSKISIDYSILIDEVELDKELYKLIDESNFNFCGKQILKQVTEHPERAYKQVKKLEKCKEELEKSGKNTVNYTDPEARKSPNKEGVMQVGYNEQAAVDNKHGLLLAMHVVQAANDKGQLLPMAHIVQDNIQKALKITPEEADKIMHETKILADNGYYTDETVHKNYNETKLDIIMPNHKQASQGKNKFKRKTQRKENNTNGFSKDDMIKDEENHCYICPENKVLPVKQVYTNEYSDRIVYYTSECSKCPSRDKCLTEKMTCKIITDYTSEAKELMEYKFETEESKELYKKRMPMVESKFAYTKHTLNYRQYHVIGLENVRTQQTIMATAQNLVRMHNLLQKQQREKATTT